jgi:glycerol 2-dehydrogenase (NADP+)
MQLPTLSTGDMEFINALDRNERTVNKAGLDGKMLGWTYDQLGW